MTSDVEDEARRSPSEYMRARHPDLYSDSTVVGQFTMSRRELEYLLETVTSRQQEAEFETFGRQLCEKEICPNLVPQTGPTGGGDAKADTETFPVADEISQVWYHPDADQWAKQRWAFAISAKREWLAKCKGDVKKIVGTGRGYERIFFVTNQFVPAKKRADTEDALTQEYKLPVRILDRNWIVERVTEGRRFDLVARHFGGDEVPQSSSRRLGPRDAEREQELEAITRQMEDPEFQRGHPALLAAALLDAALLVRSLERPRLEVEGRFLRAEQCARQHELKALLCRILYQHAWTSYWWFEDPATVSTLYAELESSSIDSDAAFDLERLSNLLTCLATAATRGLLAPEKSDIEGREERLGIALTRVGRNAARPANALLADYLSVMQRIRRSGFAAEAMEREIPELGRIIEAGSSNPEFRLEPILKLVQGLGDVVADSPALDGLIDLAASRLGQNQAQATEGRLLFQHGQRKLSAGHTYDALRLLSRAASLFFTEDLVDDWIATMATLASAYDELGLTWASRAALLNAANSVYHRYRENGVVDRRLVTLLRRLVWVELQLGRPTLALLWLQMSDLCADQARLSAERKESLKEERATIDVAIAILVLRSKPDDLALLDQLPNVMSHSGLAASSAAALYALGYVDAVKSMGFPTPDDDFEKLLELDTHEDLPLGADWLLSSRCVVGTALLGCDVTLSCEREIVLLTFSEALLAAMEAFMASLARDHIPPQAPFLSGGVRFADDDQPFTLIVHEDDKGDHRLALTLHRSGLRRALQLDSGDDRPPHLILDFFSQIAMDLTEEIFKRMMDQEHAMRRALDLLGSCVAMLNLLGTTQNWHGRAMAAEHHGPSFALIRNVPLVARPSEGSSAGAERDAVLNTTGTAARREIRHRDMRSVGLVNPRLWHKAGWMGVGYAASVDGSPGLVLIFQDADAARKIFNGWRHRLGGDDVDNFLRVTIVRGVNEDAPNAFRVAIGSDPMASFTIQGFPPTHLFWATQTHTVDPADGGARLRQFEHFTRLGRPYTIAPASVVDQIPIALDPGLVKYHVRFIEAWQIQDEADYGLLHPSDRPLIPEGVIDPPVFKALERIRSMRSERANRNP